MSKISNDGYNLIPIILIGACATLFLQAFITFLVYLFN
jgi:hypothetical protein